MYTIKTFRVQMEMPTYNSWNINYFGAIFETKFIYHGTISTFIPLNLVGLREQRII